jgi:hypothetical protein
VKPGLWLLMVMELTPVLAAAAFCCLLYRRIRVKPPRATADLASDIDDWDEWKREMLRKP